MVQMKPRGVVMENSDFWIGYEEWLDNQLYSEYNLEVENKSEYAGFTDLGFSYC